MGYMRVANGAARRARKGCRHNRSEEPDALARTSGSVGGPLGNRRPTPTGGRGAVTPSPTRPVGPFAGSMSHWRIRRRNAASTAWECR